MTIKAKPCGDYQTNCYILEKNNRSLIIDPGVDAFSWVKENAKNPLAILNTHGHFDHVWSNKEVKEYFDIPLYIRKEDEPMLKKEQFGRYVPKCEADFLVENEEKIKIEDFEFYIFFAPGHSPGCSMIIFDEAIFSGDFIFDGSIGRVDFPTSNSQDMKSSINRFLERFNKDLPIYSGHGNPTSVGKAREFLPNWINYL